MQMERAASYSRCEVLMLTAAAACLIDLPLGLAVTGFAAYFAPRDTSWTEIAFGLVAGRGLFGAECCR